MTTLDVHLGNQLVGHLSSGAGGLEFEYAAEWLKQEAAFPISVSLSLGPGPRSGAFFSNLLPEGLAREAVARHLRIDYGDDFALLEALGGECAGALMLLPPGVAPDQPQARAEELSLGELEQIAIGGAYGGGTTRGARLSLAGAQGKLPIIVDGGRLHLPLGNTPSTHLVKFENLRFRDLPANEAFTTALFRELGVPAVTIALQSFERRGVKRSACLVTRYDRLRGPHGTTRLHQEDLCQALGLSSHDKYESDGGPSFARLYRSVQEHSAEPFVDARWLLDWWLVCWLLGNSDAHAKNLALVYRPRPGGSGQTLRLAPFYDLVCTRAYPGLDARLATRIGGEAVPGQVGIAALQRATQELGLRRGFLAERARTLARAVPAAVERVLGRVREERRSRGVHQRIARVANTQARRALTLLG